MSPPIENILVLTPSQAGRRVGLSRFHRHSLGPLNTISSSSRDNKMPAPKTAAKELKQEEEDTIRPPKDDSDSSSGEERARITPTVFRASQEPVARISKEPAAEAPKKRGRPKKKSIETVNGSNKSSKKSAREIASTQDNPSSSPKRKSQDDAPPIGSGMTDSYGRVNVKKAKKGYGSGQPSSSAGYGKNSKKNAAMKPPTIPEPESPQSPGFKVYEAPELESPASTPGKFKATDAPSPFKDHVSPIKAFKKPISGDTFTDDEDELSHPSLAPTNKSLKNKADEDAPPFTQFKTPLFGDFDDNPTDKAADLLGEDLPPIHADEADDDLFSSLTQSAKCPMCNKPVDLTDLREWGDMNTRQQERFCQSHQKKTAASDWSLKGYPEINWDDLGSRIEKHYGFIKKVVNGGESHYRDLLEERVDRGEDRNLLKMTTNLTPGYYGGRGLRIMSENIMAEFTSLLKKKAVKDRRISSRGPTAFVQSVLVPEVAVLLIMEDMNVETEEAREILEDSAAVGELIHEEIRDVVVKRVEDSEDDEDEEFDAD